MDDPKTKSIILEAKGIPVGVFRNLDIHDRSDQPYKVFKTRCIRFDSLRFNEVFNGRIASPTCQKVPLTIRILDDADVEMVFDDVWFTDISAVQFNADDFIIVATEGPCSPLPDNTNIELRMGLHARI